MLGPPLNELRLSLSLLLIYSGPEMISSIYGQASRRMQPAASALLITSVVAARHSHTIFVQPVPILNRVLESRVNTCARDLL